MYTVRFIIEDTAKPFSSFKWSAFEICNQIEFHNIARSLWHTKTKIRTKPKVNIIIETQKGLLIFCEKIGKYFRIEKVKKTQEAQKKKQTKKGFEKINIVKCRSEFILWYFGSHQTGYIIIRQRVI